MPRFGWGIDRQASATAELVTDLDSGAVAAHYAQQLEHQGWLHRAEEERGSQIWSTWVDRSEDEANGYRLLFLSIVGYVGLPPRAGAGLLTEHPRLVQGYLVETRAAWRQNLER